MTATDELKQGLATTWDHLNQGWQQLRERAGEALTHFHLTRSGNGEYHSREAKQLARHSPRWGVIPAELEEHADRVIVVLEIPGMERVGFSIAVQQNTLLVAGDKRVHKEGRPGDFHLAERAYGHFERSVPLPAAVEEARARAQYAQGVLTVTLPKTAPTGARRIPIEGD